MKTALTIAGSDPTGGAGVQSDLRVFHRFSVYGLSAVSALTAQNTFQVSSVSAVTGSFLEEQLDTLLKDIRPDAVKTGMLFSSDVIRAVAGCIKRHGLRNVVVDPVAVSSTGARLMEEDAPDVLKRELFPLAKAITPNIAEASSLSGIPIADERGMEEAAQELLRLGPEAVIITGGHLSERETLELIYDGKAFHRIRGKKIGGEFHGTGCAFSAAVTALLAKGRGLPDAVREAKEFIDTAIRSARPIGKGMKLLTI